MISSTLLHPARTACAPGIGALHVLRARNCSWFGIHGWTRLALRDADARVADLGANANTGDLWPSSMTRLGCGLDRLMRAPQRAARCSFGVLCPARAARWNARRVRLAVSH